MAVYAGVSGSVRLTPQNWSNQRHSKNTTTNKHTVASIEPRAVLVQMQVRFPCKTSANVFDHGNAAMNKPDIPVQQESGYKEDMSKESCRRHNLHAGHRTDALRDEAPMRFQYTTLYYIYIPRLPFKSFSNCEVQHSYFLQRCNNHEF